MAGIGKVLAGHFKRVISRPDWSADIGDAAKTGGPAIDLHIHDTHFIGLVCGVPGQVFATGDSGKRRRHSSDHVLSLRPRRPGRSPAPAAPWPKRAGRSCMASRSIWNGPR